MTDPASGQSANSKTATSSSPFNILAKLQATPRLMTVKEVAELLGKSEATIRRMAARRQIPGLIVGALWRFDPSTLIVWLSKKQPQLLVAARRLGLMK